MKQYQTWWTSLALLACITIIAVGQVTGPIGDWQWGAIGQAQTSSPAAPSPAVLAPAAPSPAASRPAFAPPSPAVPTPRPNSTPPAAPALTPLPTQPATPLPALPASILPAAPALTAPPLPISGEYKDLAGRFKIGILQGYTVSPLAGSVLIEAPDGNLAYTVVAQSPQQLGLDSNFMSGEVLAELAQTTFQQGEDFQAGTPMAIANGIYLEWTGNLTIAGQSQPIGGVIVARQSPTAIVQVLVASTQAGAGQVPGAIRALIESLSSP